MKRCTLIPVYKGNKSWARIRYVCMRGFYRKIQLNRRNIWGKWMAIRVSRRIEVRINLDHINVKEKQVSKTKSLLFSQKKSKCYQKNLMPFSSNRWTSIFRNSVRDKWEHNTLQSQHHNKSRNQIRINVVKMKL